MSIWTPSNSALTRRRSGAGPSHIVRLSVLGLLLLLPQGGLSGQTGSLEGRAVTRSGEALPGLVVSLPALNRDVTTAPDGTFGFSGIAPGEYVVEVARGLERSQQGAVPVLAGATTRLILEIDPASFALRGRLSGEGSGGERVLPLPGLVVTSDRSAEGYVERHGSVGLGFPASIARVPQSIHVITRRMMEEQQPVTLSDVVRNTAGVGNARNSLEPFRTFKLRGFNLGETVTDGIRNTGSLNIQAEGMANIERVEVLRGPGGAIFGLGSPGGVVNIVTRKPLDTFRAAASLRFGNFGYLHPELDVTGPLGETGLRYRLIASWEDRDSFIDFVSPRALQVAPTLEWRGEGGLTLRYQGDWRERTLLRYVAHPFRGTVSETDRFQLPRSLFTGEPGQGNTVSDGFMHTVTVERVGGGNSLDRLYARFNQSGFDQPSVAPNALGEDGRTLTRRFNLFTEEQDEQVFGGQVVRGFQGPGGRHTVSAGFDLADWSYDSKFERGAITPLDVVQPVYGASPTGLFVLAESSDRFQQVGGYIQDAVNPTEAVTLLLGVRWDRLVNQSRSLPDGDLLESTDSQFSPRVGLSAEVRPGVVPFVSWSRTFVAGPSFGFVRSRDGNPFGPQRGRQWEAGVKVDLGATLTTTLATFDIEQSNVPTADPADPAFRVPTGVQRSRGVEWTTSWEPVTGVALFGSYSYTDARVLEDTNLPTGARLDNVPYHAARLWMSASRPLAAGWTGGVKGGLQHSSEVLATIGGSIRVPGFTVADGGLFASRGPLLADLMIHNLTDDYYFLRGAFGGTGVIPGDARRVVVTLAWRP